MKDQKKTLLAILITMILIIGLLPAMALADDSHTHDMGTTDDPTDDIMFTEWTDTLAAEQYAKQSVTGKTAANSLPAEAGSYYLTKDVTLESAWSVPTGAPFNLCLNGHVIKLDAKDYVIEVSPNATLNLYDCGTTEHEGYIDKDGLWHLGSSVPDGYTAKAIKGGVITGGNNVDGNGNGGGVYVLGTFNMYDGNIVGNTATSGGGVYVNNPVDGPIATFVMEGGTITGNTATNGGGVYYPQAECLAAGTPITLANGTRTAIENLKKGDEVRVFDHETGEISSAKLFDLWKYPTKQSGAFTLHFTNDIDVTPVGGHCFFDKAEKQYVAINTENVNDYIGHQFYNVDDGCWETLTGVTFLTEAVDTYIIVSEKHMNVVAGGMLSNEDGIYTLMSNIFAFDENLTIDAVEKEADIARYGLWDYENMQYFSRHAYDALNLQYMSVLFGRGILTPEEFAELEAYSAEIDPELYCGTKNVNTVSPQKDEVKESLLTKVVSFLTAPFVKVAYAEELHKLDPGVYFGGTAQVFGNKANSNENNVFLSLDCFITLGDGDMVAAPKSGMSVGVTTATPPTADTWVPISNANDIDYHTYFFADKAPKEQVVYKGGTDGDNKLYLAVPSITVAKAKDGDKDAENPVYGVADTGRQLYTFTSFGFGTVPTLKIEWKHVDDKGVVTWKETAPADGLGLTKEGKITTTATTPAGDYIFRITNGKPEKIVDPTDAQKQINNPEFVSSVEVTLTVEPSGALTVETTAYEGFYDGQSHNITFTVKINGEEIKDAVIYLRESGTESWTPAAGFTSYTDVTNKTIEVKAEKANYKPATNSATVKIKARPVTLVAGSASKPYDETPLTCSTFTVKEDTASTPGYGFITGEGVDVIMTEDSTITDVGTQPNVINDKKITAKSGTTLSNYTITCEPGTLTVLKADQPAPAEGEGYTIDYVNEKITPESGYEVSTGTGDAFAANKLNGETAIDFNTTYYVHKAADDNHNASPETAYTPKRPDAPADSAFIVEEETVQNKKDGSFSGITADMEYSNNGGSTWQNGPATLTGLSGETIKVRFKAVTDVSFKSEEYAHTFTASSTKLIVSFTDGESQRVAYGDKITKPGSDPTKDGYTFEGWHKDVQCTEAWNFDNDTVKDNMTLYPKWNKIPVPKADVGGNVTQDNSGVPEATVELMLGTTKIAETKTDNEGNYTFIGVDNGIYNIVVTKGDKTKTEMVAVNQGGTFTVNVELPTKDVNSVVEHVGKEIPEAKSDISQTVVGGLDEIAAEQIPGDEDKITIKLKVEPKKDEGTKEQKEIKEEAEKEGKGKKVEFLDLSLLKQTNDDEPEDIGANNDTLLTIVIPFNFTNVDVSSVMILRSHGGNTEKLTGRPNKDGEYFEANEQAGTLTIHAKKFSDYAITDNQLHNIYTLYDDQYGKAKAMIDETEVTSVASGKRIILTAEAKKGYAFDNWEILKGEFEITGNSFIMPESDVTIRANFKATESDSYGIIVETDGYGTANAQVNSEDVRAAAQNANVTLIATPANGYVFKKWQVVSGDITITNDQFTMPACNVKIKAIFERVYNINIQNDGHGTATATPDRAVVGESISLNAIPNNGFVFDNWEIASGDVTITDNVFTMPESNVTIKAVFKESIHVHNFKYEAHQNVITATCQGCDKKVSLILTAINTTYNGWRYMGAFTNDLLVGFSKTTGENIKIEYWTTGLFAHKLYLPPRNAGRYTAKVSVGEGEGEVTATNSFTIKKANYNMTGVKFEDATNVYDGKPHHPVISGTLPFGKDLSRVKVTYTTGQTDVGEKAVVAIFSTLSKNYIAPLPKIAKQTITPATMTDVEVKQTEELTYNGSPQIATVESKATTVNDQQPTFTYAAESEGEYSNTVPAFTDAGSYTVYYKVTAPNHDEATGQFTVTIGKADQIAPAEGEGYTIDYINEKITPVEGYEVSLDSGDNFDANKIDSETPIDFTKSYYIRKAADDNHNASPETKYTPKRPDAPSDFTIKEETLMNKKDGSFSGITGDMEYIDDGGSQWKSGPAALSGLSNETIRVRFKATATSFKSEEFTYTFTPSTKKEAVNTNTGITEGNMTTPIIIGVIALAVVALVVVLVARRKRQ